MRILVITNLYPNPYQPNRAPFNRQQFEALAAENELRIIAPIAWTDELAARWTKRDQAAADDLERLRIDSNGVTIEHPRYRFPPRILRRWYGHCYKRSIRSHFRRAVEEFKPEVVLAAWAYPDGWAAVELAREAGLPVVVKVHGSDVLLLNESKARRKRTIEALKGADGVIAVSKHLASAVIGLGVEEEKVSVVYNGVDCKLFSAGSRDAARERLGLDGGRDRPLLLFAGNLVWVKGADALIEACVLLNKRGVRFDCRLIGQGRMGTGLARRIKEAGLQERVKLIGARPLSEMPDWYRAADLLVLPGRSEGLPNVLREAIACGACVVASNVGGVSEMVREDRLIAPGDSAALAQAIEGQLSQLHPVVVAGPKPLSWQNSAASLGRSVMAILRNYGKLGSNISKSGGHAGRDIDCEFLGRLVEFLGGCGADLFHAPAECLAVRCRLRQPHL